MLRLGIAIDVMTDPVELMNLYAKEETTKIARSISLHEMVIGDKSSRSTVKTGNRRNNTASSLKSNESSNHLESGLRILQSKFDRETSQLQSDSRSLQTKAIDMERTILNLESIISRHDILISELREVSRNHFPRKVNSRQWKTRGFKTRG